MFTYEAPYHNKAAGNRSQDNTKNKDYYNESQNLSSIDKQAKQYERDYFQSIQSVIKEQALNLEMLAEKSGIDIQALERIQYKRTLSLPQFLALMYALDLTPHDLFPINNRSNEQATYELQLLANMYNCELIEPSSEDYSTDEICQKKVECCIAHIRAKLKAVRIEKGWSQNTLALKTGLNLSTVKRLEWGIGNPTMHTFELIRLSLSLPLQELQGERQPLCQAGQRVRGRRQVSCDLGLQLHPRRR